MSKWWNMATNIHKIIIYKRLGVLIRQRRSFFQAKNIHRLFKSNTLVLCMDMKHSLFYWNSYHTMKNWLILLFFFLCLRSYVYKKGTKQSQKSHNDRKHVHSISLKIIFIHIFIHIRRYHTQRINRVIIIYILFFTITDEWTKFLYLYTQRQFKFSVTQKICTRWSTNRVDVCVCF